MQTVSQETGTIKVKDVFLQLGWEIIDVDNGKFVAKKKAKPDSAPSYVIMSDIDIPSIGEPLDVVGNFLIGKSRIVRIQRNRCVVYNKCIGELYVLDDLKPHTSEIVSMVQRNEPFNDIDLYYLGQIPQITKAEVDDWGKLVEYLNVASPTALVTILAKANEALEERFHSH